MTLSCYMHMLCVPAVFHVSSWTLTRLTCGAKKHVSVGSVVRSLQATQSYTTEVRCDYICYVQNITLCGSHSFCSIYAIQIQTAASAGSIAACMCCLHMCTSSIGLGHPSTGIAAHQLRPHTKTHTLKGDTTVNTDQYPQQSTLETIKYNAIH